MSKKYQITFVKIILIYGNDRADDQKRKAKNKRGDVHGKYKRQPKKNIELCDSIKER